jgi:hypothetical protein
MSSSPSTINQALSRPGRFLRAHRSRIALWTAAIEGLLVILAGLSHWIVYGLAIVAIAFWASAGRAYKSGSARQIAWIFAASQALAALITIFLFVAKIIAVFAIAVVAVVALIFLFTDRNRA